MKSTTQLSDKIFLLTLIALTNSSVFAASTPWENSGNLLVNTFMSIAPWALTLTIIACGILWWMQKLRPGVALSIIGGAILVFGAPMIGNLIIDAVSK